MDCPNAACRGYRRKGGITRDAALGEACVQHAEWKISRASKRRAAARAKCDELGDIDFDGLNSDDGFASEFPRFSKEFWREIESDAKKRCECEEAREALGK